MAQTPWQGALPIRLGRYEAVLPLSRGGMATVYLGRVLGDAGFSRVVAIKRLHPHFAEDQAFAATLIEEGSLVARIRHANVVPVLDVVSSNGELFLVLEFVLGVSLAQLLHHCIQTKATLSPPIVLAIVRDILNGLHAAHEATGPTGTPLGIVHRDVSPQNVILGIDGVARLIDFGIAKALARSSNTDASTSKGKPGYMAPEQRQHTMVDRRTDTYAASILLWEALTTRRLFSEDVYGAVPKPSQLAQGITTELDGVILRGLDEDPRQRFQDAASMVRALETCGVRIASDSEVAGRVLGNETLIQKLRDSVQSVETRQVLSQEISLPIVPQISSNQSGAAKTIELPPPARKNVGLTAVAIALLAGVGITSIALLRSDESKQADALPLRRNTSSPLGAVERTTVHAALDAGVGASSRPRVVASKNAGGSHSLSIDCAKKDHFYDKDGIKRFYPECIH